MNTCCCIISSHSFGNSKSEEANSIMRVKHNSKVPLLPIEFYHVKGNSVSITNIIIIIEFISLFFVLLQQKIMWFTATWKLFNSISISIHYVIGECTMYQERGGKKKKDNNEHVSLQFSRCTFFFCKEQ